MPLIEWTTALEVGHKVIDDDHRTLVDIINRFDAASATATLDELMAILGEMGNHTAEHFAREELLMLQNNYEFMARHRKEHFHLFDELRERIADLQTGNAIPQSITRFIRDWLLHHVASADQPLGEALARSAVVGNWQSSETDHSTELARSP